MYIEGCILRIMKPILANEAGDRHPFVISSDGTKNCILSCAARIGLSMER